MKVARSRDELAEALRPARSRGSRIGFVPTMGALHEGHLSLVSPARDAAVVVVLSIFVNPLQFGPNEDLGSYPRDEERDLRLAEGAGVDIVFIPSVFEMYPEGRSTTVSVGELGTVLEGADRPGHFDGVATVVAKLFNLVQPDVAVFGQKDAQQVGVIKKMVKDLSYAIEIIVAPTVREADGLALSSRNAYLAPQERPRAAGLHRALVAGAETIGEEGLEAAEKNMWELMVAEGLEPIYARAVDPETFGPPGMDSQVLLVVAARINNTRLIDNMLVAT